MNLLLHFYKDGKYVRRGSCRVESLKEAQAAAGESFTAGKADFAEVFTVTPVGYMDDEVNFLKAYKKVGDDVRSVHYSPYLFDWDYKTVIMEDGVHVADIRVYEPGTRNLLLTVSGYDTPDELNYQDDSEAFVRWHYLEELLEAKREKRLKEQSDYVDEMEARHYRQLDERGL